MTALAYWEKAITMAITSDFEEAERYFDRATEVGSQYGTRSNPSICWSYAATFFVMDPLAAT